jgi:NAD(P)-dependent dehydrogenase (short-subunit alcohol dehydrogenase family)
VVGASSGLGRCIGVDLGRRGDRVALLARRRDRLVDAAQEAGPDALAVACDVTDESSCRAAVEEAAPGWAASTPSSTPPASVPSPRSRKSTPAPGAAPWTPM